MAKAHQEFDFIVSGASSGIGLATCNQLIDRGFSVLGISRSTTGATNSKLYTHLHVDLRSPQAVLAIQDMLEDSKELKGAFSNAGSYTKYDHDLFDVDLIFDQIHSNFITHLHFTKAVLPALKRHQKPASLLYNTTDQVYRTKEGGAAYSASKSALNSYAKSLAVHLASTNVVVNMVAPGGTDTPLYWKTKENNNDMAIMSQRKYPLHRIAKCDEISSIACQILTLPNKQLIGVDIRADGGLNCI